MNHIKNLLEGISTISFNVKIDAITNDSRAVTKNTLFLAFPGVRVDAREHISEAIVQGASAILYENKDGFTYSHESIPCVGILDLKNKQSIIAARFYNFPGKKIPIIGVTGTNGKTSITQFIAQALPVAHQSMRAASITSDQPVQTVRVTSAQPVRAASVASDFLQYARTGIIGTLGYGFPPYLKKLPNTTPDSLQLQKIFAELIDQGATTIAMEVSSHGLAENRVENIDFHTAVFTNLTQDHLDFHGTMDNYRDAKALLFQKPGLKNAVINIDDDTGKYFAEKYREQLKIITYSKNNKNADIFVINKKSTDIGFDLTLQTPWGQGDCFLPLIGDFNIDNALAVLGVLGLHLSAPLPMLLKAISQLKAVSGRMQLLKLNYSPSVIIDYAHTPDALEKVLAHVRAHCSGKLFCVFGCGGNRDKTKRPKMGAIAAKFCDEIIITNDNPRNEDPETIAKEIAVVIDKHYEIELNRVKAIEKTLEKAGKNDWVVIAGKGHETDQVIGDDVLHHNDAECALNFLKTH
ncbi:MAG: UDP-N-acetylmuramoyl-L-alanyl-D-glutamate--2,6-diaminopimelate ligase [Coxiellaceae bacterium]|nr:UDP-N-acetylmuramoyl-L-alanyl-D-glutamate--2,6-diaminopimelate ligase [Coxiellaceae bacterium]